MQASGVPPPDPSRSATLIMTLHKDQLLRVLRIGHDTSMRGEGISLRDALARCDYRRIRDQFGPTDLVPLLATDPGLIRQWLAYCEDKRTSGGFWVSEDNCEVGSLESPESNAQFDSIACAVAEFVVRELDYWSAVGDRRTSRSTGAAKLGGFEMDNQSSPPRDR